jgi:formimidoylglutamate deiminase
VLPAVYKPDLLYWEGALRRDLALAVGSDGKVLGQGAGKAVRLKGRALLPGLVNAHSHAFQRLLRGRTEYVTSGKADDTFWSWRERMYQVALSLAPEDAYVASRQAFVEMALAGITTVGEFHYLHHAPDGSPYPNPNQMALEVIRAARDVGLRIVLLRVGYARAGFSVPENPRQRRFIDKDAGAVLSAVSRLTEEVESDPMVTVGLAPHSVRAVPKSWLEAFSGHAGVVHMHVAEQPKEVEACVAEHGKRPVELLSDLGFLKPTFTAVHAVCIEPEEISLLGRGKVHVCACPTTERNLGDGVVPADRLAAAGARLCLGSDSQATIDLLKEAEALDGQLRLVRGRRAVLDPLQGEVDGLARRLFDCATRQGAESLGLKSGQLEVGAPADFFTVDLEHPLLAGLDERTLLPALLFGADARVVREAAVGGKLIVKGGVHEHAEASGREFSALARRVF